jgi:hypothetical protein
MLFRRKSAVCSFAYFCCCNAKCGAMCCSCRQGCAAACRRSSLVFVRSIGVVAASPVFAFRDCGQLRASREGPFAGSFRSGSESVCSDNG